MSEPNPNKDQPNGVEELLRQIGEMEREANATATDDAASDAAITDDLSRPLGEEFYARVEASLRSKTMPPEEQARQEKRDNSPEKEKTQVRRRRPPSWLIAAMLLIAAGGVYRWTGPDARMPEAGMPEAGIPDAAPEAPDTQESRQDPLPDVAAVVPGEKAADRSGTIAEETGLTLGLGDPLKLIITPEDASGRLEWDFYLDSKGFLSRWDPARNVSFRGDGTVEIEGFVGQDAMLLPAGKVTVIAVYAWSRDQLPDKEEVAAGNPGGQNWRSVRKKITVQANENASLDVDYEGCYTIFNDPNFNGSTCMPFGEPYNQLKIWARSENHGLRLILNGRLVDDDGEPRDSGRFFRVAVTPDDSEIVVQDANGEEWRLGLGRVEEPEWLKDASLKMFNNETVGLAENLQENLDRAEPAAKARALSLLGKLADTDEEKGQYLLEAFEGHRQAGNLLEMSIDLSQLIHLEGRQRNFAKVKDYLQTMEEILQEDPSAEAVSRILYNRAVYESGVGNISSALRALQKARPVAYRVDSMFLSAIDQKTALLLLEIGRYQEAMDIFQGQAEASDLCARATQINNQTWALVRARLASTDAIPDEQYIEAPEGIFDDGFGLFWKAGLIDKLLALIWEERGKEGCGDDRLKLDLLINKAIYDVTLGDKTAAREALDEAEPLLAEKGSPLHRVWFKDLQGSLFLDNNANAALEVFREMETAARAAYQANDANDGAASPELWLARLRQAQALEALGETEEALRVLEAAEGWLDRYGLRVPLNEGRDVFVAEREAGARLQVELLLRAGRLADAMDAARRSRSRVLRGQLDIHSSLPLEDESLTAGEPLLPLPPLPTDEVVLTFHPLPVEDGVNPWVVLGAYGDDVRAYEIELSGSLRGALTAIQRSDRSKETFTNHLNNLRSFNFEITDLLLEPFREEIQQARRLRLLPYGLLRDIDFHALPWNDDVILAQLPVVYGLDLRAAPEDIPTAGRALVVAVPQPTPESSFLENALSEADAVSAALRQGSWNVQQLREDEAREELFLEILSGVDLLHFVGHGLSKKEAGWASHIQLAQGDRLRLDEILNLAKVPQRIVLSSCQTGNASSPAPLASLGVAQAFLTAGSDEVLAAVRNIDDDESWQDLFDQLYRRLDRNKDLASAFREAVLRWREKNPGSDWASFRVLEP